MSVFKKKLAEKPVVREQAVVITPMSTVSE